MQRPVATSLLLSSLAVASRGTLGEHYLPHEFMGVKFNSNDTPADVRNLARRAQAGDKRGQLELGILFEEGRGVPQDLKGAKDLYLMAATIAGKYGVTALPLKATVEAGFRKSAAKSGKTVCPKRKRVLKRSKVLTDIIEMAFVADHVNFRTFDPDRELELFVLSSGSDGTYRFRIAGPGKEHYFSAHYERLNVSGNSKIDVGDGVIPIVWIIHRWYDEWKPVIREAMLAYVINHGSPNGHFKVFVRFGEKGALNDA